MHLGPVLIDAYLPTYDIQSRHHALVRAAPEDAYDAILTCDLNRSWIALGLLWLRGLPMRKSATPVLARLEGLGFMRLAEDPPREIVMGLIGRFWTPRGELQPCAPADFAAFSQPGFAKAAWNFCVAPRGDGSVDVSTETRVLCTDERARQRFSRYWTFIGPFSGLIRSEMLSEIRRRSSRTRRSGPRLP